MKKLLRGYGIREVNLLNKEIMVSAVVDVHRGLFGPVQSQHGSFSAYFMHFQTWAIQDFPLLECYSVFSCSLK